MVQPYLQRIPFPSSTHCRVVGPTALANALALSGCGALFLSSLLFPLLPFQLHRRQPFPPFSSSTGIYDGARNLSAPLVPATPTTLVGTHRCCRCHIRPCRRRRRWSRRRPCWQAQQPGSMLSYVGPRCGAWRGSAWSRRQGCGWDLRRPPPSWTPSLTVGCRRRHLSCSRWRRWRKGEENTNTWMPSRKGMLKLKRENIRGIEKKWKFSDRKNSYTNYILKGQILKFVHSFYSPLVWRRTIHFPPPPPCTQSSRHQRWSRPLRIKG